VRGIRIEVVVRSVEIHDQHVHAVEPEFLTVGLRLDEEHLLREAVRRVRLLRISAPEIVLAEGNRGELGIGADRADAEEPPHAGEARALHEERAHHEVLVVVGAGVAAVRADAPHGRREMDHDFGLVPRDHALDVGLAGEIVVQRPEGLGVPVAARLELVHHVASQEAGAAGHEDAGFRE
jgi:hypothetical protein